MSCVVSDVANGETENRLGQDKGWRNSLKEFREKRFQLEAHVFHVWLDEEVVEALVERIVL